MGSTKTTRGASSDRAAIGFRAHSGWAAMVAVAGSLRSPRVLDRSRIVLADAAIAGSKQPYHAAEPMAFQDAQQLIKRCGDSSARLARQAVGEAIGRLAGDGFKVTAAGLLLASGRTLPDLAAILASHALIHTAEGEMFREVIAHAAEHYRLPVLRIKERGLGAQTATTLGVAEQELSGRLTAIGKELGPPWRQDEKYAALAAWHALASVGTNASS